MIAAAGRLFYEYPLMFAALITALGVIIKMIWGLHKFFERMDSSVDYIEREMRFNGGSTMRDQASRVEQKVDQLAAGLTEHLTTSQNDRADLRRRIDHIDKTGFGRGVANTERFDSLDTQLEHQTQQENPS